MADAKFWSDDFDMDLPKVFPDAKRLLGDLADVELVTRGTPDQRTGRLNHPCVWNSGDGMVAFFGFNNPGCNTEYYCAPRAVEIRCTAWEAFRDAWAHQFHMIVEQQHVWNSGTLWPEFETIMWDLRKVGGPRDVTKARRRALMSLAAAIRNFGRIVNSCPSVRRGSLTQHDMAKDAT